jgi:hypothetical protein
MPGCRDLGEEAIDTARPGARGRLGIRVTLKAIARAHGASHIHDSGHVLLADSNAQRERGHFHDCTAPAPPPTVEAAPAPRSFAIRTAFGGQLELVPVGTLRVKPADQLPEADLAKLLE